MVGSLSRAAVDSDSAAVLLLAASISDTDADDDENALRLSYADHILQVLPPQPLSLQADRTAGIHFLKYMYKYSYNCRHCVTPGALHSAAPASIRLASCRAEWSLAHYVIRELLVPLDGPPIQGLPWRAHQWHSLCAAPPVFQSQGFATVSQLCSARPSQFAGFLLAFFAGTLAEPYRLSICTLSYPVCSRTISIVVLLLYKSASCTEFVLPHACRRSSERYRSLGLSPRASCYCSCVLAVLVRRLLPDRDTVLPLSTLPPQPLTPSSATCILRTYLGTV